MKNTIVLSNQATFKSQVEDSSHTPLTNRIFDIGYDFDLNNETVTIGAGCVLKFSGGQLKNGVLSLNETEIIAGDTCFYNIKFRGDYSGEFRLRWIGISPANSDNYTLLNKLYSTFLYKVTKFVIEGTINIGTNGLMIPDRYSIRGENQAKLVFSAAVTNSTNFCLAIGFRTKLQDIDIYYDYLDTTGSTSAITLLDIDTSRRNLQSKGITAPNEFTLQNVSFSQVYHSSKSFNATAIRITCTNNTPEQNDDDNYITRSLISHCFINNIGTGVVINNTNYNDPDTTNFAWANQIYFDRLYIAASDKGFDVTVKDYGTHNPASAQSPFIVSSYEFQALKDESLAFVIDGGKFLIENFSNYDNDYIGEVRDGHLVIDNIIAGYGDFQYGLTDSLGTYDNKGGIHVYSGAQLTAKHSTSYTGDKIMLAQDGYLASNGNDKVVIESLKHGVACSLRRTPSKAFASYKRFLDDGSALFCHQYANANHVQQTEIFRQSAYDHLQSRYGHNDLHLFLRFRPAIESNGVTCYILPYNVQMYKIRIPDSLLADTLYRIVLDITISYNGTSVGYATFRQNVNLQIKSLGATSSDVDILTCSQLQWADSSNFILTVRGKGNSSNFITLFVNSASVLQGQLGAFGAESNITDYMEYYINGVTANSYEIGKEKGTTAERPDDTNLGTANEGFEYYDSTLKKKILWNGTTWVNMDGSTL